MVGLDLLRPLRLAGSHQVCGPELMDFGVTAAADPSGALGDLQVNRLSGHGDHFQQPPGRRREVRRPLADHVIERGQGHPHLCACAWCGKFLRVGPQLSTHLRVAHQLTDEERITLRFAGNALCLRNYR